MKLAYTGQEKVTASPEVVWDFVQDPNKVAACLPDVHDVNIKDDRHFDAVVGVSVGPVRGKFKFNIELVPDKANNKIAVKLRGGGLGTAIDLIASADINGQADATTLVDWQGEATVSGPAATVGGRVLDGQAKKLISLVFANMGQRMSAAGGSQQA